MKYIGPWTFLTAAVVAMSSGNVKSWNSNHKREPNLAGISEKKRPTTKANKTVFRNSVFSRLYICQNVM